MLGNFNYCNPTKLYFGKDALNNLNDELKNYGKNILLTYGGGSVKKSGLYDEIVKILKSNDKNIIDLPGVMANPTVEKLYEGCKLAKENSVDLILAVGGGSVCDYSKAVSVSTYCNEDPWDKYFLKMEDVDNKIIPVGCVLTMVGTGSEMNGGSVITNHAQKLKIGHVFGENVFPKFSILNPEYTFTVPQYQMVAGFFDIMSHIMEQYFSGEDDNTSDYIAEGLMRSIEGLMKSLITSSRIAVKNPRDYEARSNIMWTATWALNTLIAKGKSTDWEVHMIGQAVGAYTNATHGMTLSAVSIAYYKKIMQYAIDKFARFAVDVWGISPYGKSDEHLAILGIEALEDWIEEIGAVSSLKELGVDESMFEGIADSTFLLEGGYKKLTREEVIEILKESM